MKTDRWEPWRDVARFISDVCINPATVAVAAMIVAFLCCAPACQLVTEGTNSGDDGTGGDLEEAVGVDVHCGLVPCRFPDEGASGSAGSDDDESSSSATEDEGESTSSTSTTASSSSDGGGEPYGPCDEDCLFCAVDGGLCTVECEGSIDCPQPPDGPQFCHEGVCLLACPCPDGAECVEWAGSVSCSWNPPSGTSSTDG